MILIKSKSGNTEDMDETRIDEVNDDSVKKDLDALADAILVQKAL